MNAVPAASWSDRNLSSSGQLNSLTLSDSVVENPYACRYNQHSFALGSFVAVIVTSQIGCTLVPGGVSGVDVLHHRPKQQNLTLLVRFAALLPY